jgi:hypothetical protein
MKTKQLIAFLLLIAITAIFLNACAPTTTPEVQYVVVTATVAPITSTPDPCGPESINDTVQKVHNYMREFDDASVLAASIMQSVSNGQAQMSDLSNLIPNLQRIRREAEDQPTPACLVNLKTIQISDMNAVINSLNAFVGGDQKASSCPPTTRSVRHRTSPSVEAHH